MNENIIYRTKDGRADYYFSIEQQSNGSLRAYITSMPSYGARANDPHTTHRLSDNGRKYVCWSREIYDENELKSIISVWSDMTQKYLKAGITIDEQMRHR